ncbi:hypothetical protein DBB31_20220 [Burkholderia multivorans]|nr:hypothetical protein DBB31_20220 [Burkholderia multivorans]
MSAMPDVKAQVSTGTRLHGLRRNTGADVVPGGRVHRERHANPREGHPIYLSHGHMSGQPGLVENRSRDRITTQE